MEIDALNRMLQDIRENDDFRRRERSIDIPGIYENQGGMGNVSNFGIGGGFNFTGIPSGGGRGFVIQEPQLGPDEFGSYSIPVSDPTYRSGFDYARSIAGGMPMSQVIAPGVSYSPEQPMGYTQEQLNIPRDVERLTPPKILPPTREPDDPRYFGTGIGGVTIFDDKDPKAIPLRDIITGKIIGGPPIDNLQGRGFSVDRENLDRPRISGLENRDLMDVDSLITGVPTGRDFSVDREPIPLQDFGYGPGVLPPLPPMDIRDIPPKINDQIFIDDRPIIDERIVDRGYGPGIMPPLPPMDIDKLIPPVDLPPINITDLPPINIMDLPPVDLPPINIPSRIPLDLPIVRPPTIMDKPRAIDRQTIMDELTGGRFSINQKRPMGLF